jgi:tetratricopeptide (TPR) repeat protein
MSIDFLSHLQTAKSDEEREWLVMQFSLNNLTPAMREAVWAAAIPHWFDTGFLDALLAKRGFGDSPDYQSLLSLSFVETFPGRGHNVHDRSRSLLLKHLWQDASDWFRELSRRAADYCSQQDLADTGWYIEAVYHLLISEPDDGVVQLQSTGRKWHNSPNFAYDKVEAMLRIAREHADANRLSLRGVGWTLFWEALLDCDYSRYDAAKSKLLQINANFNIDGDLVADSALLLGTVHRILGEYEAAKIKYKEALELYRQIDDQLGEANCIRAQGIVHRILREYEAAKYLFQAALTLFRQLKTQLGEANCVRALGDVHLELDEYAEAAARYGEALALYRQIKNPLGEAHCVWALGYFYQVQGEYQKARMYYENALAMYRRIGHRLGEINCISGLADLDLQAGQWSKAEEKYQQALDYYESIHMAHNAALALYHLGLAAKGAGHLERARNYYQSALERLTKLCSSPDTRKFQAELDDLPM